MSILLKCQDLLSVILRFALIDWIHLLYRLGEPETLIFHLILEFSRRSIRISRLRWCAAIDLMAEVDEVLGFLVLEHLRLETTVASNLDDSCCNPFHLSAFAVEVLEVILELLHLALFDGSLQLFILLCFILNQLSEVVYLFSQF